MPEYDDPIIEELLQNRVAEIHSAWDVDGENIYFQIICENIEATSRFHTTMSGMAGVQTRVGKHELIVEATFNTARMDDRSGSIMNQLFRHETAIELAIEAQERKAWQAARAETPLPTRMADARVIHDGLARALAPAIKSIDVFDIDPTLSPVPTDKDKMVVISCFDAPSYMHVLRLANGQLDQVNITPMSIEELKGGSFDIWVHYNSNASYSPASFDRNFLSSLQTVEQYIG